MPARSFSFAETGEVYSSPMLTAAYVALCVFGALVAFALLVFIVEYLVAGHRYTGPVTDHFDGIQFHSIGVRPSKSMHDENEGKSVWKWLLLISRRRNVWIWRANAVYPKPAERVSDGVVVTFVNHATVLIQVAGLNIITDSMWSKRASPFTFLGPKRFRAPGIAFDDLPPIDMVLLSHNHYDHLDLNTLKRIAKKWSPKIYTALGNTEYLAERGVEGAQDMDWWDEVVHGPVKIVSVPAQHFSARAIRDRNGTLWCGFVIETSYGPIYFAGDTGYGAYAAEIKKRYEKFILGLIPIGAYLPDWMMRKVHMSPDEALALHKELCIDISIGIHHSTFKLADDLQDEPIERIRELVAKDVANPDFRVLDHGESLLIGNTAAKIPSI